MGPEDCPGTIAVPNGFGLFVVGHAVENVDFETRKHGRCAAQNADVKFRTEPFRGLSIGVGTWRNLRGGSHKSANPRKIWGR